MTVVEIESDGDRGTDSRWIRDGPVPNEMLHLVTDENSHRLCRKVRVDSREVLAIWRPCEFADATECAQMREVHDPVAGVLSGVGVKYQSTATDSSGGKQHPVRREGKAPKPTCPETATVNWDPQFRIITKCVVGDSRYVAHWSQNEMTLLSGKSTNRPSDA